MNKLTSIEAVYKLSLSLLHFTTMSSEHSELRVLRGIHHHHASLHELVSLHSHMLIAQIEKLRTDVATLETDLTESRLKVLEVLK